MQITLIVVLLLVGATQPSGGGTIPTPLAEFVKSLRPGAVVALCPVLASARASGSSGHYILHFTLINAVASAVTVDRNNLPWSSSALTLVGLLPDGGLVRDVRPIMDHFMPDMATVLAGKSLEGDAHISWGFDGLNVLPKSSDILIVWSFPFRLALFTAGEEPICSGISVLRTAH